MTTWRRDTNHIMPPEAEHKEQPTELLATSQVSVKASKSGTASQTGNKPEPDDATIEALLAMTRIEHDKQYGGGKTPKRWWSMSEWVNATPTGRRALWIRLGVVILMTVILSWLAQVALSHSRIGKAATGSDTTTGAGLGL